jgi:hypothetical protein
VRAILDESFDPEAWVVFEVDSHFGSVCLRCRDYERLMRPRRLRFAHCAGG